MEKDILFYYNTIKKVGKSCKKYDLFSPGDKVLIGLSGGKDSLFLLEALYEINRRLENKVEIIACHIHIKEAGYKTDQDYLYTFCQNMQIPLLYEEISANLTENPKKSPCFVCSWHRRKRLFEIARELHCNKLALGHHANDAIETLLMNMVYHGSISSLPAKLRMFEGRMYLIRPLIEQSHNDLLKIAFIRNYPSLKYECGYSNENKRTDVRNLVSSLELLNKNARKNIFRSMSDIYLEYLPDGLKE